MNQQAKAGWYDKLVANVNNFAEELGLDDFSTSKFRDFVVSIAKDQYRYGNKCGAAWAFKQNSEKATA